MIDLKYNEEENIIYVKRFNDIELDELIGYFALIEEQYPKLETICIIDDIRNSCSKYKTEDFPTILDQIKKKIANYKTIRCALIVDSPNETARSILYENIAIELDQYAFKTFSTIDAAKLWLKQGFY